MSHSKLLTDTSVECDDNCIIETVRQQRFLMNNYVGYRGIECVLAVIEARRDATHLTCLRQIGEPFTYSVTKGKACQRDTRAGPTIGPFTTTVKDKSRIRNDSQSGQKGCRIRGKERGLLIIPRTGRVFAVLCNAPMAPVIESDTKLLFEIENKDIRDYNKKHKANTKLKQCVYWVGKPRPKQKKSSDQVKTEMKESQSTGKRSSDTAPRPVSKQTNKRFRTSPIPQPMQQPNLKHIQPTFEHMLQPAHQPFQQEAHGPKPLSVKFTRRPSLCLQVQTPELQSAEQHIPTESSIFSAFLSSTDPSTPQLALKDVRNDPISFNSLTPLALTSRSSSFPLSDSLSEQYEDMPTSFFMES